MTVDLSAAQVSAPACDADGRQPVVDLLPGERVSIDRSLSELPRTVVARQVIAPDHAP